MVNVLGLASRGDSHRLSMWMVEVSVDKDGTVQTSTYDPWKGTLHRDDASQLLDTHDAISNALDAPALGEVTAVAVKRVETPLRGKPGEAYDRRVWFEAAAMLAAQRQGKRFFQYRSNQLGRGAALAEQANAAAGADDEQYEEALAAACAALGDLGQMPAD
jgi:hypothetical protein